MNEKELKIKSQILRAAQVALFRVPTPNLRAITLAWNIEKQTIYIRSYFDKPPCEIEKDLVSNFATVIGSDFSELWLLEEEIIHLPAPQKMEMLKEWIYIRYEGELGVLSY